MCIIAVCKTKRENKKRINIMFKNNPDGAGIAYRENGLIHWIKGINDPDEVHFYAKTIPLPYVLHFRITSTGETVPELTHPFILDTTETELQGETDKGVLFMNGTFTQWEKYKLLLLQRLKHPNLQGKWSDTRLMSYLVALYGEEIINFLDTRSRYVVFTPTELNLYGNWQKDHKIYYSNNSYKEKQVYQYYGNWYNDHYKNFRNQVVDDDWNDWR